MKYKDYEIKRLDNYNIGLLAPYEGKDKDGNPKTQINTQYYSSFKSAFAAMVDLELEKGEDMKEIKQILSHMNTVVDFLNDVTVGDETVKTMCPFCKGLFEWQSNKK